LNDCESAGIQWLAYHLRGKNHTRWCATANKRNRKDAKGAKFFRFLCVLSPRRLFSGQVCLPGNKEGKMTKEEVEAKVAAGEAL
jgi:hypothetical protein